MTRPFLIGLTGSIGMGKSTTAQLFAELGADVWDADAAVHRLYSKGGAAVQPISEVCPLSLKAGAIDRGALKDWIARDPNAIGVIESIVHPLVAADRRDFIEKSDASVIVLDIPLLFETGGDAAVDLVVVVATTAEIQRERVLQRPGMTEEHFSRILAKQMPSSEKVKRAGEVVDTTSFETARADVRRIMEERVPHA